MANVYVCENIEAIKIALISYSIIYLSISL